MTTTATTIRNIWRAAGLLLIALIAVTCIAGAANAATFVFAGNASLITTQSALPVKWLGVTAIAVLAVLGCASLTIMWRDMARHLATAGRRRRN